MKVILPIATDVAVSWIVRLSFCMYVVCHTRAPDHFAGTLVWSQVTLH